MRVRRRKGGWHLLEERRRHDRIDVWEAGLIWIGGNLMGIPCRIEDMSLAGARLDCSELASLPGRFTLEIGPHYRVGCEVVWQDGSRAGVRFVS